MYSQGFNEQFTAYYDFVDFIKATGLQSPRVGPAYQQFKQFAWDYIQKCGLSAITECFEAWSRNTQYVS